MKNIVADIKGVKIGYGCPVTIQTMCNCSTNDIDAALAQCRKFSEAGAQLIRLTTQGLREVESLGKIKEALRAEGNAVPLVADVHFSSDVAIAAAKVADKVRINPGNFAKEHSVAQSQFRKLIAVCKEYGTALRIGINHGSLGERITSLYGNTARGMMEAMKEWVEMCIEENFFNTVLSLKASNTIVMSEAYRLLYAWMKERGYIFPLHLGVTEAGNGDMGRIKSAVGMAPLLDILTKDNIGATIRVSLTEDPVNEVYVAGRIASYYNKRKFENGFTELTEENGIYKLMIKADNHEEFIVHASLALGEGLLDRKFEDFMLEGMIGDKAISAEEVLEFKSEILQAARIRFDKCEYVACPGCGRTMYDLQAAFNEVKARTADLKGYCIAVMGCIVNGPGEMADADYGYVGEGGGKVTIYRKKEPVFRSVPQEEAVQKLLELIKSDEKERFL